MPIEDHFKLLALDRKHSVPQLTKAWRDNSGLSSLKTPRLEAQRFGLSGSQLITRLLCSAQELEGRVVGRNNDDAAFLCKGLEVLLQEWEAMESRVNDSNQLLEQYEARQQDDEPLSSPESSDERYATRQQSRIHQLEQQEERLLGELRDIKTRWESIMAKTMEHQASIHRQQMREREVLVAQKDAELQHLRQRVRAPQQAQESRQVRDEDTAANAAAAPAERMPPPAQDKFLMAGRMVVGQTLQILGPDESSKDNFQWYQIDLNGDWLLISGATRNQYSPEPEDRGYLIGCCVSPQNASDRDVVKRISSKKPIEMPQDVEEWVDALVEQGGDCFGVVVVQKNGMLHTNREVCTLDINPHNLQLRLRSDLTLQQPYNSAMQVCGARGAGSAAAQGVFLALRPHEVYMLVCETPRERNACILLIRRMADFHGLRLKGP